MHAPSPLPLRCGSLFPPCILHQTVAKLRRRGATRTPPSRQAFSRRPSPVEEEQAHNEDGGVDADRDGQTHAGRSHGSTESTRLA